MSQNRPPPAFQEYAASMMARTDYRILNLAQRGLLMTMRLECWVNIRLPLDAETLGRILGFSGDDVKKALPAIMPFFVIENGFLICPELEDYRAHLQAIHDKKAEGGKRGAAITNRKRNAPEKPVAQGLDDDSGIPRVSRGSLVKSSSVQPSKTQPPRKSIVPAEDAWVTDYARASNGY